MVISKPIAKNHDWACGPTFVLKSLAHVAPKDHTETQALGCNLCPRWTLRAILPSGPYRLSLLRTMSGSIVLLQLRSELMSRAHVTLGVHKNHA